MLRAHDKAESCGYYEDYQGYDKPGFFAVGLRLLADLNPVFTFEPIDSPM